MKPILLLFVAVSLLTGCNRPKPPATPPATVAPPPQASQTTIPLAAAQTGSTPAVAVPADVEKNLRDLTDALRAYFMTQGKAPTSMQDLVKAGLIRRLPEPPPGKRFAIDPSKSSVVLVDR
ncbi:MAG: hypothetical protein HY300_13850 [Verrucomicrobia bacterium]|nr:hypothetical protein [Verrucomicrobiota bacterium]